MLHSWLLDIYVDITNVALLPEEITADNTIRYVLPTIGLRGKISEAPVATAVGLIVALPAVAAYNAFTRHVETAASSAEAVAHQILGFLKTAGDAGHQGGVMAGSARQRGLIAEINVTPLVDIMLVLLVDIMLVLLIVFMLTANLIVKQAIEIELPHASQGATTPPPSSRSRSPATARST